MNQKDLFSYIKTKIEEGVSQEVIKKSLLEVGWKENDVDTQFKLVLNRLPVKAKTPSLKGKTVTTLGVIFLTLVLVFLFVLTAFTYFFVYKNPERVLFLTYYRLSKVNSLEYQGNFDLKSVFKDNSKTISLKEKSVKFVKSFEEQLAANEFTFETKGRYQGGMNVKNEASHAEFEFSELDFLGFETKKPIQIEIRNIKDVTYLKFESIGLEIEQPKEINLIDSWIRLDFEEFLKELKLEKLLEEEKALEKSNQLSDEQNEKLKSAFQKRKIIVVTEELPAEKINGKTCFHYVFKVDPNEIIGFLLDFEKITGEDYFDDESQKSMKESIAYLEKTKGDIWISKFGFLPQKVVLNYSEQTQENETFTDLTARLEHLITSYDKEIQVETPVESISLAKALEDLMVLFLGESFRFDLDEYQQELEKDTDGDKLSDTMEEFYGTDLLEPDTDKDGFSDFEEVEKGFNPNGEGKLFVPSYENEEKKDEISPKSI